MDKMDHLMAEKNKNNKDSQKEQVTPKKKYLKKAASGMLMKLSKGQKERER